jgi:hypothetical protein
MLKLLRSLTRLATCCALLSVILLPSSAVAATSTQAVVQSYGTDQSLQTGMIVGLTTAHANQVEALTMNDIPTMQGVVVAANTAAISLSGGSSTSNQVYVATSGTYNVLVSTENGPINVGDYISISSLNGIGMKTEDSEATVVGKALAAFSGKAGIISTATIKKTGGGTALVDIGLIPVDITIVSNPTAKHGIGDLPGFLEVASSSIANKPVSAPKVYLSLLILLLSMIISGSLLYSGVKNSIVSIGRNPLARSYIIRGLLQVVLFGIIIFVLGIFAVYLLLRL